MYTKGIIPAGIILSTIVTTGSQSICIFVFMVMYIYLRYRYTNRFTSNKIKIPSSIPKPETHKDLSGIVGTGKPPIGLNMSSDDSMLSRTLCPKEKNAQAIRADINNGNWGKYYTEEFGESHWWDDDEYETSQKHDLV